MRGRTRRLWTPNGYVSYMTQNGVIKVGSRFSNHVPPKKRQAYKPKRIILGEPLNKCKKCRGWGHKPNRKNTNMVSCAHCKGTGLEQSKGKKS